jgi:hypothetical protein
LILTKKEKRFIYTDKISALSTGEPKKIITVFHKEILYWNVPEGRDMEIRRISEGVWNPLRGF